MSIQLIQQYYAKKEQIIRYGGSRNESTLRKPFQDLLEHYARSKNLVLVGEVEFTTKRGNRVVPDGTLKDALRQDWGFWESKDEKDILADEIETKFAKGYPSFNILFEDTNTAILYQGGEEVMRASFTDPAALDALLTRFVSYERPEVREFHKAIEQFSLDVPALAKTLREIIEEQYVNSLNFKTSLDQFLELCRKAINPKVEMADVREMVIQHILTEDIFMRVFDEAEFHRENVIARNLQNVAGTFYKGATKRNIDARIAPYYETINARAAQIYDHHEKQKFLKALYENFYKAYNPKAADRLGVIYTPDEIVRFLIEGTDYLLDRHFGKSLGDQYVEILDPATGTGTFITELIEYLPLNQLDFKYDHEIHCNEVAILPYYIANLNIEYTYKQKTGKFKEFENICFVDTLDNIGFTRSGEQQMSFFGLWDENAERIKRQNLSRISVIIGNPPYNANQTNENENNKNREYPQIDQRIRETYIKSSTAQKTKLYDMYARFYRWASDRLDKNGVIAFITNNSFLDSRTFDGFRKVIAQEFSYIYIVDLGGNIRKNPKLSGPTHNVFAIQTGVAIAFLVKKPKTGKEPAKIFYTRRPEMELARDKLDFLRSTRFEEVQFDHIQPDKNHNWVNLIENDWDTFIPLADKIDKKTIFNFYANGVVTARDEWVYDFDSEKLAEKIQFLVSAYNNHVDQLAVLQKESIRKGKINIDEVVDYKIIKWSAGLKGNLLALRKAKFDRQLIRDAFYKPYVIMKYYADPTFSDRLTQRHLEIFGTDLNKKNNVILVNLQASKFKCVITDCLFEFGSMLDGGGQTIGFPRYKYEPGDNSVENISDWALGQFQRHYKNRKITKDNIFEYAYAVLHSPIYRAKYEQNLKRDIPRVPFYDNFFDWVNWGKALINLHLHFDQAPCYPLKRIDLDPETNRKVVVPILIARKDKGQIDIDTLTTLSEVPKEAWEYKFGTRSAIEWILERYKERASKDSTLQNKFNTYRFVDYKEQVIDLLKRVCTVSVETVKIINSMT